MIQYESYTDEELIALLRGGENGVMDFLMEKYKNLVRKKANALFLFGGDTDDLIQEGMIGLFKAIRDFEEGKSGFYNFAELCINRQIYTAIESAARKKHAPLNSYISLSTEDRESSELTGEVLLGSDERNPENILIDIESVELFRKKLAGVLSHMELQVLDYYLEGQNYHQIAELMGKKEKAIDNALQRIRGKVQQLLQRQPEEGKGTSEA